MLSTLLKELPESISVIQIDERKANLTGSLFLFNLKLTLLNYLVT